MIILRMTSSVSCDSATSSDTWLKIHGTCLETKISPLWRTEWDRIEDAETVRNRVSGKSSFSFPLLRRRFFVSGFVISFLPLQLTHFCPKWPGRRGCASGRSAFDSVSWRIPPQLHTIFSSRSSFFHSVWQQFFFYHFDGRKTDLNTNYEVEPTLLSQ